MKIIKIIYILLIFQSCKANNRDVSLETTWYEVQKRGGSFILIDCGYEGQWFQIRNDSLYEHDFMEDSKFRIKVSAEKNGWKIGTDGGTFCTIIWESESQGVIQWQDAYGNIRYYVNEAYKQATKIVKGKKDDCLSIESDEDTTSLQRSNNVSVYNANGDWKIDCTSGRKVIVSISGNEAFLEVLFNQVAVTLTEIKRYPSESGIAYCLKKEPEDKGSFGVTLPWKAYLNEKPVAYIKLQNDNTAYFYWYGFYNSKTRSRDIIDATFMQECSCKEIVVKRCLE